MTKISDTDETTTAESVNARTPGRVFYDRKLAQGKTKKKGLRALKRSVSDAVWRQLQVDLGRR